MRIVPDTSVIIEGLSKSDLDVEEIIIAEAVLAELEHQANHGKTTGEVGLHEIKVLREKYKVTFKGQRPKDSDIKFAAEGAIDHLIRELAYEEDATLFTADKTQYDVALAKGIKAEFFSPKTKKKTLLLEKYFTDTTMSVHLREDTLPKSKVGVPGSWVFDTLSKTVLKQNDIKKIATEIIEEANFRHDSFIELERPGSTIVQLGRFRTVITRPPFSDGWEITAVRPVKHLSLAEYKLSEKLQQRIIEQAEGILIAGSPGMGKSTFAAALIEEYAKDGKIVKTIEAPRDLVLPQILKN